jgi:hypothetical protein
MHESLQNHRKELWVELTSSFPDFYNSFPSSLLSPFLLVSFNSWLYMAVKWSNIEVFDFNAFTFHCPYSIMAYVQILNKASVLSVKRHSLPLPSPPATFLDPSQFALVGQHGRGGGHPTILWIYTPSLLYHHALRQLFKIVFSLPDKKFHEDKHYTILITELLLTNSFCFIVGSL